MPPNPHFDPVEAKALIAMSAKLAGPKGLPEPPLPSSWDLVFSSPVMGPFDNMWQLWKSTDQYAVLIRGTVIKTGSIIEDLMAVMIPAQGDLPAGSVALPYRLAADPKAGVHLGFALGMAILLCDGANGILAKLGTLVPDGASLLIAGHSQGAALATLCRSFLHYSPILAEKQLRYKTYLYAQPKPGNDHYGWDFESLACNPDLCFRLTNPQDWVPQVPLTIQLLGSLNEPNPLSTFPRAIEAKIIEHGIEALREHLIGVHLAKHQAQFQQLEQVLKAQTLQPTKPAALGTSPPILPTLNFVNCGSPITLPGTPGVNPSDPKDFLWQHHAAMYYKLLCQIFP